MAVAIENPETLSDGDGATASFPTVWTFETAAEVVVTVRGTDGVWSAPKVEGVDYDLTGTDWPLNGATVVFRAGKIPADDTQVLRRRVTPTAQAVPFGDQANFRPRSSEETFDRLTRQVQEERAKTARAVLARPGESGVELPAQAARGGTVAIWNDTGTGLRTDRSLAAFDADVLDTAAHRAAADAAAGTAAGAAAAAGDARDAAGGHASTALGGAAAAQLAAANAVLSSLVPIFPAVANAVAATIPAAIKALRTQFYAPTYAVPATLTGGADYARVSKAVIDAAGYPALAWFRSVDRFMPDGTTDAVNGGYWLIDTTNLNVTQFGAVPDGAAVCHAAFNAAIQTALAAGGGDVRGPRGTYLTGATIFVLRSVALIMAEGSKIKPNGDFDVIRQHAKSHVKGCVDAEAIAGFSKAGLLLDGADEASAETAFRLHTKTSFDFEMRMSRFATSGIAVHLKATTTNARIMGIQGRLKVYGGEYGVKEEIAAIDGSNFITGVDIYFEGSETRRVIDQYFGAGGFYHIDAHRWYGSAQPREDTTVPMYNVGGQLSTYVFIPWDWNTVGATAPFGLRVQEGARQSRMIVGMEIPYAEILTTEPSFVIDNMVEGLNVCNTPLVRGRATGNLVLDLPNGTGGVFLRVNGGNALGLGQSRHLELYGFSGQVATVRNFNTAPRNLDLPDAGGTLAVVNAAAPASLAAPGVVGQQGVTPHSAYVCHGPAAWSRHQADGFAFRGDEAATLQVDQDVFCQVWVTPLTANRAVTLSDVGAVAGARFRISRPAGGAFNLNVGPGPLKALPAASWCEVAFSGSAWVLTAYGDL